MIIENIPWMTLNILFAVIPVLFGWLFYKSKSNSAKVILFTIWLAFVPNTIYIFTDFIHFLEQINEANLFETFFLAAQYSVLMAIGFITYILSLYPIEKKLKLSPFMMIGINFLIGFGMVIGRIHRLNSWDIIFKFEKVALAALETITTPEWFLLAILFGLFGNFIYFLFKKITIKNLTKYSI